MNIPLPPCPWDRQAKAAHQIPIRRTGLRLQQAPMSAAAMNALPVRSKVASASVRRTTLHLHRSERG
jgi:hypothetical protein